MLELAQTVGNVKEVANIYQQTLEELEGGGFFAPTK